MVLACVMVLVCVIVCIHGMVLSHVMVLARVSPCYVSTSLPMRNHATSEADFFPKFTEKLIYSRSNFIFSIPKKYLRTLRGVLNAKTPLPGAEQSLLWT